MKKEQNFNVAEEETSNEQPTKKKIDSVDFVALIESSKLSDIKKFALSRALVAPGGKIKQKAVYAFCHALDNSIKDKSIMVDSKKSSDKEVLSTGKD
jgi:hypothetical protein